ncbi:RanGTP-binding protein-domain-containing protein [Dipodascopsis uninucleata]
MEDLLARAGNQAVTFAIRSGISLVSGYAIRSLTRFLDKLPDDQRGNLERIKRRLHTKIKIVTPAIDLIQLIAARGNTSLDSTVALTRQLRHEINGFEERVENASVRIQQARNADERKRAAKSVEEYMLGLLSRVEDAIPLISLALTTSGANLSASLPNTVSPSRLMQASTFLFAADSEFGKQPNVRCQVGPTFILRMYSVFYGTARNPHITTAGDITWKEEFPKCYVEIFRVPIHDDSNSDGREMSRRLRRESLSSQELYSYELVITEDLDDGRYHEEFDSPVAPKADAKGRFRGRTRSIPISIVTRLFFSASGRLLQIDDAVSPVLVIKLNKSFLGQFPFNYESSDDDEDDLSDTLNEDRADDSALDSSDGDELAGDREMESILASRIDSPSNIEWLAFELWTDDNDSDLDDDSKSKYSGKQGERCADTEGLYEDDENEIGNDALDDDNDFASGYRSSESNAAFIIESSVSAAFSRLTLSSSDVENMMNRATGGHGELSSLNSLSLLEYLLRLTALQTNDQSSAMTVTDERIALYLQDENRSSPTRDKPRDVSDPIGPEPSPILTNRHYPGSDGRQMRSRSGTPFTPVSAEGHERMPSGGGSSGSGSGSRTRQRKDISNFETKVAKSMDPKTTPFSGQHSFNQYSTATSNTRSQFQTPQTPRPASKFDSSKNALKSSRMNKALPTEVNSATANNKESYKATNTNNNSNSTIRLTPWELDRIRSFGRNIPEDITQSPLQGKSILGAKHAQNKSAMIPESSKKKT